MTQAVILFINFVMMCGLVLLPSRAARSESRPLSVLRQQPDSRFADLLVLQIAQQYETEGVHQTRRELVQVLDLPKLSKLAKYRAQYLLAELQMKTGNPQEANQTFENMGFLTDWNFVGPFSNESNGGLSEAFVADTRSEKNALSISPNCSPSITSHPCLFPSSWLSRRSGKVTFESVFESTRQICAYAQTQVNADADGDHLVYFGAGGQSAMYVNDALVFEEKNYYRADMNRYEFPVLLRAGVNRITVKTCSNDSGSMEFFARIFTRDNQPLKGHIDAGEFIFQATPIRLPLAVASSPLYQMDPGQRKTPGTAHMGYYAQYALLTGAVGDDARAIDAAYAACKQLKEFSQCATYAALATDINVKRQAFLYVLQKDPNHVDAQIQLLLLDADVLDRQRAKLRLERIAKSSGATPEAFCGMLRYYGAQLPETARQIRNSVSQFDGAPLVAQCKADNLRGTPTDTRATQLLQNALQVNFTSFKNHLTLLELTVTRNKDAAIEALEMAKDIGAPPVAIVADVALLLLGSGHPEATATLYSELLRNAPAVVVFRKAAAEFHLGDNPDLAVSLFEESLSQSPQDKVLRNHLAFLAPQDSFADKMLFAADSWKAHQQACVRDREDCYLVNNTIIRVHPNGLASTITQVVVAIGTQDGARQWQRFSEEFSSSQTLRLLEARLLRSDGTIEQATSRATFPVSEPWYRLYYDIEAEMVELPMPAIGDVVEFQFRVDDISPDNIFGNYFGTMVPVNGAMPVKQFQLAVIRPRDFFLRFEAPPIVTRRDFIQNDQSVSVFTSQNIDAIVDEPSVSDPMAMLETIHVTSWDTFSQMEHWYSNLIRSQLIRDEGVQTLVASLTRHLKTRREKIAAIYNWVTTNIRYVGLEFGIHGYKPYTTAQIRARGFGDCKDTASLLVAMLTEAGIDAHVALVRTRSAGRLRTRLPSLSLFNHAIAFVPEYNLWLDGTATFHGTMDFPYEDQGIQALVIGLAPAELRTTSEQTERDGMFMQTSDIVIQDSDDAQITAHIQSTGAPYSPWLRNLFATAARDTRLQEQQSEVYPGIHIDNATFTDMNDLEKSPNIRFNATVPRFVQRSANQASFTATPPLSLKQKFGTLASRKQPLLLGPAKTAVLTLQYKLPRGSRLLEAPDDVSISSEFATYQRKVSTSDGAVRIERTFVTKQSQISPSDYGKFLRFIGTVDTAERAKIRFEKTGEPQ